MWVPSRLRVRFLGIALLASALFGLFVFGYARFRLLGDLVALVFFGVPVAWTWGLDARSSRS